MLPDKSIRRVIDHYLESDDFDAVASLAAVRLVASRDPVRDTSQQQFCQWFVFGEGWNRRPIFEGYRLVLKAERGDVIVYRNEHGEFTHVGRIGKNERVISKWGAGHIFEHDAPNVPSSYGNNYFFLRKE